MIIVYDAASKAFSSPGHPERPARISETVKLLQQQKSIQVEWDKPCDVSDKILLRAHSARHLKSLEAGADFDVDTPALPKIAEYARTSVGGALMAMKLALTGKKAFSLMRPPGHHAERERAMGFCYLNQAAVCAEEALASAVMRVAVFDFDVHHGNGTENILAEDLDAMYCSVHQFPCYPGTGRESRERCYNFPIPPESSARDYLDACEQALHRIHAWQPQLLIVSAGFDAYHHDPLAQQKLDFEDFEKIGRWVREISIPAFSLLEGGYSGDLPECILAYLKGWEG